MTMKTRLSPFAFAVSAASLFVPVLLAACGGKGVSIGSNSGELRTVQPATVAKVATACAAKTQAHPNVCCEATPNGTCVAYVNSPFHKCETGTTTYPDPNTCCDLNDPTNCVPTPPPPPEPPPVTCGYACQPGWYPVANEPGTCCHMLPDGNSLECESYAYGTSGTGVDVAPGNPGTTVSNGSGGQAGGSPGCATTQPAQLDDAGQPINPPPPTDCDAGAPVPEPIPVPPPPPWPGPICNQPCPDGFTPLPNDPATCCNVDPSGNGVCFSQAGGPVGTGGGTTTVNNPEGKPAAPPPGASTGSTGTATGSK